MTDDGVRHDEVTPARLRGVQRAMARGYADGLSRAVELALLPVVFGFLGWLVDRAVGTAPLFLLVFVAFAFAGMLVRMWVGYDAEMRRHEQDLATSTRLPRRLGGPRSDAVGGAS